MRIAHYKTRHGRPSNATRSRGTDKNTEVRQLGGAVETAAATRLRIKTLRDQT